ncbi:MAG TPA: CopG family antitoxin [Chloroflexota bacterium]|nr:CopG family antitoxin [Chloroflexota bacterium]
MTEQREGQSGGSRIPRFASREEEAEFWDTHDITEFKDELAPARVRFAKNLSEGITIRLDAETLSQLRIRAREKGIGPTTLARMWILERLKESA